ncbi:MAG: hypothetical protein K6G40_04510 [Eubacterium sp.]|nr:hypothetical protein [Eubacterium sp.]
MQNSIYKKIILCGLTVAALSIFAVSCGSSSNDDVSESSDATEEAEEEFSAKGTEVAYYKKSETVTASGDATGNIAKISVESTLSDFEAEDGDYVKDSTTLTNIKNKKGAEEFLLEDDGTLYWQNLGEKITYNADGEDELPVSVKITYYLDGTETSPKDMEGVSGEVKIRYEFENVYEGSYVPFVAVPVVALDDEVFKNIEVENGKLVSFGDSTVVVGMVIPGFEEYLSLSGYDSFKDSDVSFADYVEITADAEDFELDFSSVIVKNGLTEDIDEDDLGDIDDLADSLEDLGKAGDELEEAAADILSGSKTFKSSLETYTDGVSSLADGLSSLDSSLSSVDVSSLKEELQSAIAQEKAMTEEAGGTYNAEESSYYKLLVLAESLEEVKSAVGQLDSAGQKLKSGGSKLLSGYNSLNSGLSEFKEAIEELNEEGLSELSDTGKDIASILKKIRRLKKNDLAYDSYGGYTSGADCDVTYIIECDGI